MVFILLPFHYLPSFIYIIFIYMCTYYMYIHILLYMCPSLDSMCEGLYKLYIYYIYNGM